MRRAWTTLGLIVALGCDGGQGDGRESRPTAPDAPTTTPAPAAAPEAAPEATPPPEPADPFAPTPPQSEELLVLDTTSCDATGTQSLVNCYHDWQALLRTPAAPAWALCTLDPADVEAHAPVANELWRGHFTIEPADRDNGFTCKVGSIDARLLATEHHIEALTDDLVAGVATAATVEELGPKVDLEAGPVRAMVGGETARVRFLSVYLSDVGPLLAVPGRELMTREELRAALDEAFASEWPGTFVQGARHFKPQVQDQDQRHGFGYTPTLPTCPPSFPDAWWSHCAIAVPVMGPQGRRYLIMGKTVMRSPNEHMVMRGLLLERIVEDGLEATPEAIAYAKARRGE